MDYSLPTRPDISIIIPVYNVELYLRECLDSVIGQTLCNIEIICINDGSTDNSLEILHQYVKNDPRIIIIDKINGGLSSARNAGLEIAKGKYILFLDSDDYIDLELCWRTYEKAEALTADVVFFNAVAFTNQAKSLDSFFRYPSIHGVFYPIAVPQFLMQVSAWNRLYKSNIIQGIKFFEGICFEDQPFSIEVNLLTQRAALIDQPMYYYRRDNSSSITRNIESMMNIFDSYDLVHQVLKKYAVNNELLTSVVSISELINYKSILQILPIQYRYRFFKAAQERFKSANWEVLVENCWEYNGRFWPWSKLELYTITCLRKGGFLRYLIYLSLTDWRHFISAFQTTLVLQRAQVWLATFDMIVKKFTAL